jgi:hypothetical protein
LPIASAQNPPIAAVNEITRGSEVW